MKFISTLLGGCAKVLPLVGIVTAAASIGFSVHEAREKHAYREAKLKLFSDAAAAAAATATDIVDEADTSGDE